MFLGIEIGGTKLQLGVGRGDQAVLETLVRHDVVAAHGAQGILRQIEQTGRRLAEQYDLQRVGIGFGGPVDGMAGRVTTSHQVDGWDRFPFTDWIRERLNLPAVMGNDCDCAALAEAHFGAGRGARTVFYITVGTGVGGGLVIDGRVHGTDRPSAAEIGHLRPGLEATDPHVTVESIASGPGIAATAAACLLQKPERIQDRLLPVGRPVLSESDRADLLHRCGGDEQRLSAVIVGQAAADGNRGAQAIIRTATDTLGWGIAQIMALVAPDVVIVGGGVSLMGEDLFYSPLRRAVARYLFPPFADDWRVTAPALDEEVVVHGAVALAAAD